MLAAARQRACVAHDGQGAAAEHDRGQQPFREASRLLAGAIECPRDVHAVQRFTATGTRQRIREPIDDPTGQQVVVAVDVQPRRGHAASPARAARLVRSAARAQARRRTSSGRMPAARQTSASRRAARARTVAKVRASHVSG